MHRKLAETIKSRLSEKSPLIQVVLGPRQVGKTTALRSVLSKVDFYESADSPVPFGPEVILEWWEASRRKACHRNKVGTNRRI
jgi:Cdc6-like AAA superfamily ATPase